MKIRLRKLLVMLFAIGTIFYSRSASAATYYYVGAGSPSVTTNWNTDSIAFGGSSPASFAVAGDIFILMSGQTTSTTIAWVLSGAGQQLIVRNGATLNSPFNITIPATGTFQIDGGGTYNHNNTSAYTTTIFQGTEMFGATSNVVIQATANVMGGCSTFGNLTISYGTLASLDCNGSITNINGNFTVTNTGGGANAFRFVNNAPQVLNLTIAGNYTQSGGTVQIVRGNSIAPVVNVNGNMNLNGGVTNFQTFNNTLTFNLAGSYNQTAGTLQSSNATTTFHFTGPASTFSMTGGVLTPNNIAWEVDNGAFLTMLSNLTIGTSFIVRNNGILFCGTNVISGGVGTSFNCQAGGTIGIGSAAGIVTVGPVGNIQTAIRTFSVAANYIYNGTANQVSGNALPATVHNLTINNTGAFGNNNVALGQAVTTDATGVLTLANGMFVTTTTNIVTVSNELSTAVVAINPLSWINGPMRWQLPTGASASTYVFPVGTVATTLPFSLSALAGMGAPVVEVQAFSAPSGGSATPPLASISNTEYWQTSVFSGSFGTASVSLARSAPPIGTENVIAISPTVNGAYTNINGSVIPPAIINSDPTGLGFFVMATVTCPDGVGPSIIVPASDLTVECDGSGNSADLTAWLAANGGAMASDPCGPITWTNDFTGLSDLCGETGAATVTFTATDNDGFSSNTTATFTIVDTTPPSVTCAPDDVADNDQGFCSALRQAFSPFIDLEDCDGPGDVVSTSDWDFSVPFPVGTTTVTWTSVDGCANAAICTYNVIVTDVEAPHVAVANDWILTISPVGTSLLDEVSYSVVDEGTLNTVASGGGFGANSVNTIVIDLNSPGPFSFTISTEAGGFDDNVANWTLTCNGNMVNSGTVGNPGGPSQTLTFTGIPACLDVDTSFNTDPGVCFYTVPDNSLNPTVIENCVLDSVHWDLTGATVASGSTSLNGVQFNTGTTTVTFTGYDNNGNSSTGSFEVVVTDAEAPVIAGTLNPLVVDGCVLGDAPAPVADVASLEAMGVAISDNCTPDPALVVTSSDGAPAGTCVITFIRTYTVTDLAGNSSQVTQNITVQDTTAPALTGAPYAGTTGTNACMSDAATAAPFDAVLATTGYTDDCGGAVTAVLTNTTVVGTDCGWTVTYDFDVLDACNNATTGSYSNTGSDQTAPALTGAPYTGTTGTDACMADATTAAPFDAILATTGYTDNCGGAVTAVLTNTTVVGTDCGWTVTYDFDILDACNNPIAGSYSNTGSDQTPPVITFCPGPITISNDPGMCSATVAIGMATATDNCAAPVVTNDHPSAIYPVGITIVTWTATDNCGNTATCTQSITVNDTEAPVIVCPADINTSNDPGTCGAVVNYVAPVGTDNCPGAVTTQTAGLPSGSTFPVGTTVNTFVVTDASGNSTACSFNVTVNDTEAPVIVCPADINTNNDPGVCGAIVNYVTPVGTDNCPGSVTTQTAGLPSGSTFPVGTTVNTFVVTDASGNSAACSFNVTVNDTEAPAIVCPADINTNNDPGVCGAVVNYVTPVGTDNCPGSVTTQTAGLPSGSTFPVGTTLNTFVVTDASGNSTACSFNVTVNDTEAPAIVCPADINTNNDPGVCGAVVNYITPVGTDNCPGAVTIQTAGLPSGSTFPIGTTVNTFVVTDASGNSAACSFNVTVNDTEAPAIVCPADINTNNDPGVCGAVVNYVAPVGTDNCAGSVTTQTAGLPSGSTFPVGTTVNTFVVTDASGNSTACSFNVTVNETEAPMIVCPADINTNNDPGVCGAIVNYVTPVGTDNCPGSVTTQTAGLPSGSTFPIGTTVNTFVVTDASGNSAACSFNVTVNDTEAPAIVCPADINTNNDPGVCGAIVNYVTPVGTDNCPGSVTTQTAGLPSGSTFPIGTTVNTFVVTDASGNSAACSFNVTVNDTEAPVIVCPADINTNNDPGVCGAVVNYVAPVGTDNCPGAVTTQTAGLPSGSTFPVGTTVNTFVVTDASGNSTACSFNVTVNETEAPVIVCPADINTNNDPGVCGAVVNYVTPVGTDNCPGSVTVQTAGLPSGSTFPVGTTVNTFVVTDASGNSAACSFNVTVNETEAPVIVCPADINTNNDPGVCGAVVNYVTPVGTDNCPGEVTTQTAGLPSGSTFPVGTTVNTFVVTDASGNSAACSFNVTVNDTEAPAIVCPADINTNNDPGVCGAVVNYVTPVGTDNCAGSVTTQTAGLPSGSTFPIGTTLNTFVVTDASGNSTACSFNVTVNDTEAPVIICPADIAVGNDPGVCGAVVNYITPVGTDNCPGEVTTQTAGLPSGSTFPIGTTLNTFVVTDASGNSTACSFNVTVNDTEAPAIVCPADINTSNDPGTCGAVVNYVAPVGTDNCPGAVTTQTAGLPSGSTFPVGTTVNTFVVTDASGNSTACSFNVTVNETEAPVIVCPADVNTNNDPGVCGAVVNYVTPVGTDNCPGEVTTQTAGLPSGSTFPVGTTVNTFVVTDASGNSAACSFNVTVNDTEAPAIVCPADINTNNDPGVCGAVVNYITPVGTDNCPGSVTVQTAGLPSGSTFPIGTTLNTFVVTDASGNSTACSFNVTVNDTEAPVIVCPADINTNNDPGVCGAIVNYVTPVGTDNCPGSVTVQTAGLPSGSAFPVGTTVNTFVVTDASGNSTACSFNVTVNDTESPAIVCPADINTNNDPGTCGAVVNYVAPVGTDNCPGAVTVQTAGLPSGSTFPVGTTVNTFVVTDASGNSTACSFNVTVNETEAPVIVCPADINTNNDPGVCGAIVNYVTPVGTDNCPGEVTTQTAGLPSGSTFPVGTTVNTFVVTDASGNSAACSFNVTVNDTESPAIVCPADINTNNDPGVCGAVVNYITPVGTDNCPGSVTTQTAGLPSGSTFPVGTTLNTFVVTDASGNSTACSFNVTVNDTEAPAIVCPADINTNNDPGTCGAVVNYVAPVGTDNCPGAVTVQTAGLPSGSTFPVGTTVNTFVVTDASGNSTACSFNVTVNETESPVIVCPADINTSNDPGTCGAVVNYVAPVGTDNCPGAVTVQTAGLPSGSTFPVGTTVNTFVVTDASGNSTACSFNVTVNETESPVIVCPADINTNNDPGVCGAVVNYVTPVGTDNCPGEVTTQTAGLPSGSTFPVGTTVNTFVVTDASGNSAACSFNVTVNDTESPAIVCPADIVVGNDPGTCDAVVNYVAPVGTDNCAGSITVQTAGLPSGSTFPVGTTVNTFVVTDASGNSAACSFNVTVNDTEAPAIVCPADINTNNDPGTCGAVVNYIAPVGTDNCAGSVTTQTAGLPSGSTFPVGTTVNTFVVTDASGNSTACSFNITVNETEAPVIVCPADINTNNDPGTCGAVVNYVAPIGTDNCPGAVTTQTAGLPSGSTFPVGTTVNTFVVTDASGNSTACSFNVTVNDTESPAIVCPADIVVGNNPGSCDAVVNYVAPVGTDNCPGSVTTQTAGLPSGSTFPVGTTVNTFVVTDASGNSAACSFNVTVNDTEAPAIVCPADIVVPNDPGTCDAVVNYMTPVGTDNCPGSVTVQTAGLPSGSTFAVGTTVNTFVVTDASGNSTACSFNVTVNETEAPVIVCPGDINTSSDPGVCGAVVNYVAPVGTDNCPGAVTVQTAGLPSGSTFPVGTTVNTFVVTDASGNSAACSFNVTVNDTEAPAIVCPADIVVGNDPGTCDAVVNYVAPVGTDNCPGSVTVQTAGLPSGSTFPAGTTVNTFVVTDASGNSAACSFNVTVNDTEAPSIVCPADINTGNDPGTCDAVVNYVAPVGTDNCPGAVTAQTAGLPSGSAFPIGVTTNTFVVTDASGNSSACSFTVTVTESEAPVAVCAPFTAAVDSSGNLIVFGFQFDGGSTDNCGIDTITVSPNTFDCSDIGVNAVTITVFDVSGNSDNCNTTLTVEDNIAPVAVCNNITVYLDGAGTATITPFSIDSAASFDNCGIQSELLSQTTFDCSDIGPNNVVLTVTDVNGNSSICNATVTVADTLGGSFTSCPSDIIDFAVPLNCGKVINYPLPTTTDNCSATIVQIDGTGLTSGQLFPVGVTPQIFVIDDGGTYIDTCSFTITIIDNQPPTITSCPANIIVNNDPGQCDAIVNWVAPTASDNCPGVVMTTTNMPGSTFPVGLTTVVYTATDASGNTTTCTFDITVIDAEDPVLTCPGNIIVGNDPGTCDAIVNFNASATDNCPGVTVTQIAGPVSGSSFPVGSVTTITFEATDASGNSATCTFTITVNDTEAPAIVCPADINSNNDPGVCGAVVNYVAPIGTDNCPGSVTTQTAGLPSGSTFPVGTTVNTFVVTDASGNSTACSFNVTVNDTEAPAIVCPADINTNNDPGVCGAVVNYVTPVGTDNCPGSVTTQTAGLPSGSTFPVGTTVNTFVVTDASGNSTACSFNVTVNDIEAPAIVCPGDINTNNDPGICGAVVNYVTPVGTDNCPGSVTTQTTGLPSGSTFPVGTTVNTFVVTDASGNSTACSFNVTVNDTEAPAIACPADINTNNDPGVCGAIVNYVTPVGTDNCPGSVTVQTAGLPSGSTFPVGTTVNTFVVTDASGNSTACSFNVTVNDNEVPTATCGPDVTVPNDPGQCSANVIVVGPTTADNCGVASIVNDYNGTANASDVYPVGTTVVTWTITDLSGNTSICIQLITVNDTEAPVAICNDITVNTTPGLCGASVNYTVNFTENCPGATIVQTDGTGFTSGSFFPVGSTVQTYMITDASGNSTVCSFNVIVIDNEAPLVICPSNISDVNDPGLCGANITMVQPVYSDNCNIASVINDYNGTSDGSDFYPVGVTTVIWTVTDVNGNSSTCSMTVTITDNESPAITCAPDQTQANDPGLCSAFVTVVSPVANDNCAMLSIINDFNGTSDASGTYPVGTTTVTWTATDINGNSSTCTQDITVTESEVPVIVCAPDQTQANDPGVCGANVTVISPAVSDNCGILSVINDFNGTPNASGFYPVGSTSVTWTATDLNGNTSTCVQIITVTDNEDPVPDIAILPTLVGECSVTAPTPTATDNCDGTIFGTTLDPVTYTVEGTYVITWTYTDGSGNSATQTQTVIIDDTTAPVPTVDPLPTITEECTATVTPPTAFDNCLGMITGTTTDPLTYTTQGTFIITWTYDDGNGNTTTQTQTVIVDDVTAPVADVDPLPTITDECSVTISSAPTATDNCIGTVTGTTTDPLTYSTQGTFIITWTYDDGNGNTSTQTQTVIIDDNTAPVPNVDPLPTITAECNVTIFVPPTADDNCVVTVNGTTTDPLTYSTQGTFIITWTYDDGNGNTSTQTQQVIIDDVTAPVADVDPLPTVTGECSATVVSPPTASDNCVGSVTGTTTDPLTYSTQGTFIITWTYDDGNGNTSTQTQTVVVDDVTAPVPVGSILPTLVGECSVTVSSAPTANDNCSGTVTGTTFNPLTYTSQGTYIITWTYDDGNGNTTVQTQQVIVDDVTAPVPDTASLSTITAECSVTLTPPTATDNCEGTIVASTFDPLTYSVEGTYNVTWIYFDGNGNSSTQTQTVIVDDNTGPVPDSSPLPTIFGTCSASVSSTPTATDNCSGAVTGTTTDPLTYSVGGTYTITWTYTDASGNTTTQTQTVIVDDDQAPVPDASSLPDIVGECSASVTMFPTATDNCVGSITGTTTDPLAYSVSGTYIITWEFDDGNGNITYQNQTVIVTDNTAPVPTSPFLQNVTGNCAVTVFTAPTANDNCAGAITGTTTDALSYNVPGTYTITWVYDDGNGNITTQNQTVIVYECLGIDPSGESLTGNIYPNPSGGVITIELSSMPEGDAQLRVIDELGQVVYLTQVTGQLMTYDLSYLRAATYYVQVLSSQGNFTKTIIITHKY